MIEYFKGKGDQHFTKKVRGAEITIDLVLQADAKKFENKVNWPEDAVVCEMIQELHQEKIYVITKYHLTENDYNYGSFVFIQNVLFEI